MNKPNIWRVVPTSAMLALLGLTIAGQADAQRVAEVEETLAQDAQSTAFDGSASSTLASASPAANDVTMTEVESDAIAPTSNPLKQANAMDAHSASSGTNAASLDVASEAVSPLPVTDIQRFSADRLTQADALVQPTPATDAYEQMLANLKLTDSDAIAVPDSSLAQVTSVSQLSDVKPTDWAFQALQSLVARYGCIAGYPDGTFKGNRALGRYEFAAVLEGCLDRINELLAATTADLATKEELATLQRLQDEFAAELAALSGQVDVLEARTAELEANQFSTTTKLFGQVVMGIQGRTENDFDIFLDRLEDKDTQINIISNTQLSFFTQFSPNSILLVGLQAGDGGTVESGPSLSNFVRLGYEGDTGNDVVVSDLTYRHLIANRLAVIVGTEGVNAVNVFRGSNRVESAGFGPISRFAQRNPIISIGNGSTGLGLDWQIMPRLSFQALYSASLADNAQFGGLFGGDFGETSVGAQLVASPLNNLDIAIQYVNSYSPFGRLAAGVGDDQVAILGGNFRAPTQTNAFGASLDWRITRGVTLGGWFGYTTSDLIGESGTVETMNWMSYLNFPDLFGEGHVGGIYVGQPPKITSSDLPDGRNIPSLITLGNPNAESGSQPNSTLHLEAFYRYQISDNITLTPGVIYLINPGHNDDNDNIFIGALRTTFTF